MHVSGTSYSCIALSLTQVTLHMAFSSLKHERQDAVVSRVAALLIIGSCITCMQNQRGACGAVF